MSAPPAPTDRLASVYGYYQKGYRRLVQAGAPGGMLGPLLFGEGRNCAAFSLEVERGRIARAAYRCTTCVTLIGFCEHLSELVLGITLQDALSLGPDLLLVRHPEVPAERRNRAHLAVAALRECARKLHHGSED